eukprot:SAG31_NODE_24616_length_478_cov_0.540897_1_plen_101_part_01
MTVRLLVCCCGQSINVLDDAKRRQLVKELAVLHQASCPHIVTFCGAFYDDHQIYVALEYMDGGALQDVLRKARTFPPKIIAACSHQILSGLQYLHEKHQVH